ARLTYRSFLLGLAIPLQATIIPVYYLITQIQLYDTLWAIILPSAAFAIPLSVVILANFLRDVPNEQFESMRMDGAGHWRMVWSLVLPLTRPAVVTVAVYDALQVWNGFLFPLILTQSPDQRVLPLALWSFQGQFTVNIPAVLAAVVLSTLPVLALYILGRRQLIGGLTAGFGRGVGRVPPHRGGHPCRGRLVGRVRIGPWGRGEGRCRGPPDGGCSAGCPTGLNNGLYSEAGNSPAGV